MGTDTSEVTTSKDEPTDAVHDLAEAYARIECVEETTDKCADELEAAKTAIGKAHSTLFDAEVDRAHRELSDDVESDE
jgi:hypothetical protein